jgi:hypothetical protein
MTRVSVFVLFTGLILGQPSTEPRLRVGPLYYTPAFPDLEMVLETEGASEVQNPSGLILVEDGIRGGTALSVRKFSDTGQGVAVLLAMDASGSMRGKPLRAVRAGLGQFVSKARDNDRTAVLSLADDLRWETTWSSTREETRDKLAKIEARGRYTVLWDALDSALDELSNPDLPARRHLVVISDGHDEGSKKSLEDAIAKALRLRIPVDAIGMTRSNPRYLENLEALFAQTQGTYSTAPNLDALTQMVGSSIDRMLESPVARFHAEKIRPDGAQHTLGVYWKTAERQDEMSVLLPATLQHTTPSTQPVRQWPYIIAAAGLATLLIALAVPFLRRRETIPQAFAYSDPPVPPPDAWLPTPDLPLPPPATPLPGPGAAKVARPRRRAQTQYAGVFPDQAALLIGKSGPLTDQTFRVNRHEFWIGAAENNDLRIDDDAVSSNHACLRFEGETLKVFDNHSTNNTRVNGQIVGDTARILFPGDEIRIGRTVFVVERSEKLAQSGSPSALS